MTDWYERSLRVRRDFYDRLVAPPIFISYESLLNPLPKKETPMNVLDLSYKHGFQTKDGRKARYLGTVQGGDGEKFVFAIRHNNGTDECQRVYKDGRVGAPALGWAVRPIHPNDVQPSPVPMVEEKIYCTVSFDAGNKPQLHSTKNPWDAAYVRANSLGAQSVILTRTVPAAA